MFFVMIIICILIMTCHTINYEFIRNVNLEYQQNTVEYRTQTTLNQYDTNLKKKDIMYYNLSINLAEKYPKKLFSNNITFFEVL